MTHQYSSHYMSDCVTTGQSHYIHMYMYADVRNPEFEVWPDLGFWFSLMDEAVVHMYMYIIIIAAA